ncbi:hypothetical protein DFQ26_000439 [Actinomortierella ambigua]|nr:hypothetical protein DFQ26_000439 [Actinomortierella ambigua]
MHLSIQILVSAVLAASTAVLAAPTGENPQRLMVFPCPEEYGTCNSCTFVKDPLVKDPILASVTRKVCGETYSEKSCLELYDGGFLCDDNCNSCSCAKDGLISTLMLCPAYKYNDCVASHGTEAWTCGKRQCVCNKYGIASYYAH